MSDRGFISICILILVVILVGMIIAASYTATISEENTTAMIALPGYSDETVAVQVKEWKWISDNFIRVISKSGTTYYAHEKNVLFVRDGGE